MYAKLKKKTNYRTKLLFFKLLKKTIKKTKKEKEKKRRKKAKKKEKEDFYSFSVHNHKAKREALKLSPDKMSNKSIQSHFMNPSLHI